MSNRARRGLRRGGCNKGLVSPATRVIDLCLDPQAQPKSGLMFKPSTCPGNRDQYTTSEWRAAAVSPAASRAKLPREWSYLLLLAVAEACHRGTRATSAGSKRLVLYTSRPSRYNSGRPFSRVVIFESTGGLTG